MIFVARSSGAVPAAIACRPLARQPCDQRPDLARRRDGSRAGESAASSAAAAGRPQGSGSAGCADGRGTAGTPAPPPHARSGSRTACERSHPPPHGSSRASTSTSPSGIRAAAAPAAARIAGKVSRKPPALEGRVDDPALPLPHRAVRHERPNCPEAASTPRAPGAISGNPRAVRSAPGAPARGRCTDSCGRTACGTPPSRPGRAAQAGTTGYRARNSRRCRQSETRSGRAAGFGGIMRTG